MPRHCYILRVFTREGEGGNHLGVVTDVLGLDDSKMQGIAADLGFSETIFLNWFEGSMPKARIFTPNSELAFAGHPLVGAAWVLINLGPSDPGSIECSTGPVKIRQTEGLTWIDAQGGQPVTAKAFDAPDLAPLDVVEVLMPSPYLLVRLASPDEVARTTPAAWVGSGPVYVWAWDEEDVSVRARFFAPDFGIDEDPATGSAAVALASRLRDLGQLKGSLTIDQGEETGYPSRLNLAWDETISSIGGTVSKDEVRFLNI